MIKDDGLELRLAIANELETYHPEFESSTDAAERILALIGERVELMRARCEAIARARVVNHVWWMTDHQAGEASAAESIATEIAALKPDHLESTAPIAPS